MTSEEYIRSIELPYTIMRPVFFFYNYTAMRPMVETGTLSQPLSPQTKLQQLSEDDYGEMVAEVFDRPAEFLKREKEVASVDMTMTEIAAAFSHVLGKTVNYQQIPFAAFQQQAGEEVTIMYRWFENVGYAADLAELKRDFSKLTDFESYLRDHGWTKPADSTPLSGQTVYRTSTQLHQALQRRTWQKKMRSFTHTQLYRTYRLMLCSRARHYYSAWRSQRKSPPL